MLSLLISGDFSISGSVIYFNSSHVAEDMKCIQLETVEDTIVEGDEVIRFQAVTRNTLDVFFEDNDEFSLTVSDNDGMVHVTLEKHRWWLAIRQNFDQRTTKNLYLVCHML